MTTFFSNFPLITYNGNKMVNITKSLNMSPTIFSNPFSFTDYSLEAGERSDLLSSRIYSDPYMEWLVFLSNQQLDPYSWYKDYDEFYDYVNQKYGDWLLAQNKIKYYVNNWYTANSSLIPGAYDALLPNQTKYFEPQYDGANNIIQYNRKKVNWKLTTNHIVQCKFTNTVPIFTNDEFVNVTWSSGVSGNGQVSFSTNTALYFQHVIGNYMPNNGLIDTSTFQIYGQESNNTITITNTNQISVNVVNTINPTEYIYYDPVTYFDYENMLNESKKKIVAIDPGYASQIITEFGNVFK